MNFKDISSRPVTVIGGGVLGRRLCLMWACTGRPVILFDTSSESAESALKFIEENIGAQLDRTGCKGGNVTSSSDLAEAVKDSWMVIEAVPEILDAKIELLGQLDKVTKDDCILATNSSSFRSSQMLENVERKNRVLNTHYYMPPNNACVELMSCSQTDPSIFDVLMKECASVGFKPILVKQESTGLIFNRIWAAIKRESLHVLSEGVAEPADIDMLFKDWFGANDGPCDMMDKVGLDTVRNIEMNYIKKGDDLSTKPIEWLKENYVDKGQLGAKTGGNGLYRRGK